MTQFRTVPSYDQQITPGSHNDSTWYRYFQQNETGTPPSTELAITVTSSPFSYVFGAKGFVILSGGTVSNVMFSRTPGTFYLTGQTAGIFPGSQNDVLKVTFTVKPLMTFVPT